MEVGDGDGWKGERQSLLLIKYRDGTADRYIPAGRRQVWMGRLGQSGKGRDGRRWGRIGEEREEGGDKMGRSELYYSTTFCQSRQNSGTRSTVSLSIV